MVATGRVRRWCSYVEQNGCGAVTAADLHAISQEAFVAAFAMAKSPFDRTILWLELHEKRCPALQSDMLFAIECWHSWHNVSNDELDSGEIEWNRWVLRHRKEVLSLSSLGVL